MYARLQVVVLGVVLAAPVWGQQTPNQAPGFRPEGLYELQNLDQVSYFNGGLSISGIPIGLPLKTSSHLSLQLLLTYSSSSWEATPLRGANGEISDAHVFPRPQDNSGLGWRVSIGELYQPPTDAGLPPNRWIVSDSTGSLHTLYPTLHSDDTDEDGGSFAGQLLQPTNYSRDGANIRVRCERPGATTYGDCWVDLPSGEKRFFKNIGTTTVPVYRIEWIDDAFGNWIQIQYDATTWTITDQHSASEPERKIVVTFQAGVGDQPKLIDYIDFPCFVVSTLPGGTCENSASRSARWNLAYGTKTGVFPPSVFNSSPSSRSVQVLTEVGLPNGSTYSMPTSAYDANQGKLNSLTVPTLGKITWHWSDFEFPAIRTASEDCQAPLPPSAMYWTATRGIDLRREFDRGGTLLSERTYSRLACPNPESPQSCPADEQGDPTSPAAEHLKVTTISPLRDLSEYFFALYPGEVSSCVDDVWGTQIREYGMPYTRKVSDPDGGNRFLSAKHYECASGEPNPSPANCTLVRTVYQAWEADTGGNLWNGGEVNDRNRRMISERTVYETDGSRWKKVDSSDWDGLGHFRQTTTSSNFAPDHDRTVETHFNPDRGTYPGDWSEVDPGDPWILAMFDWRRSKETGIDTCNEPDGPLDQFAWEEFWFDPDTGFLKRQRTLKRSEDVTTLPILDNLPRNNDDVVRVYEQGAGMTDGEVRFEGVYGGDVYAGGDGAGAAVSTLALATDFALPAPDFRSVHDYAFGSRKSTRYTDGDGNTGNDPDEVKHFLLNLEVDGRTGLVRSSSDVSDVKTTYGYDTSNRLSSALPSAGNGLAADCYSYSNATAGARAAATRTSYDGTTCSGTALSKGEFQYDGLGRLAQERRFTALNSSDDRYYSYDAAGHRSFVSEWSRNETEAEAKKYGQQILDFDAFGRAGKVQHKWIVGSAPGTEQTEVESTIQYLGDRQVTRTKTIASVLNGSTISTEAVSFIERYDDNGRLSQVIEKSGTGGSEVNTYYSYDVGGRLKRSETDLSGTSGDQIRCWEYDHRGFLLAEEHPELAGTTDPTTAAPDPPAVDDIQYLRIDAMGHARRSVGGADLLNPPLPANDGPEIANLGFAFDRAERLIGVSDRRIESNLSDDRILKEWVYATANDDANRKKGKAEIARSYNFPVFADGPLKVLLREVFKYGENGGAKSQRTLQVSYFVGTPEVETLFRQFEHFEDVTALGLRNQIDYPKCSAANGYPACDVTSTASQIVTSTYSYGLLKEIGGWTSSSNQITYHPNGMWNSIEHSNGVIETQSLGVDRRERPKLLKAMKSSQTLWKTGTYLYDPAGNIVAMGSVAAGEETNEHGLIDKFLYDRAERLKHAWVSTAYTPAVACLFCDGFNAGNGCLWSASDPPLCSSVAGEVMSDPGLSPEATRTDEQEYAFDSYGNIGSIKTWVGGVLQPLRDTATSSFTNRLTGTAKYDSRGNQTQYFVTTFTYDRLNRLVRRNVSGEDPYHFLYTADDERALTIVDHSNQLEQRWTLRDFGGKVLRELGSGPGAAPMLRQSYIHRGQGLFAAVDQENYEEPTAMHYTTDHLGTTRLETSPIGQVNQSWKYFPSGEEIVPAGQGGLSLRFTGHERDRFNLAGNSDDQNYMHARFHSPLTGRFLSVDSVGGAAEAPQTWNRYTYSLNSPVRNIDPDGRTALDVLKGAMNAVNSSLSLGAIERRSPTNADYEVGQSLGDWASLGIGLLEVQNAFSGMGASMGLALATSEAAAIPALPILGKSAVQGIHGGLVVGQAMAMLGENGTKIDSKTLWKGDGARIDVENAAPGSRPGQVHFQVGNSKFIYDPATGKFDGAPRWVNSLLKNERVRKAVEKGMRYLGELPINERP